MLSLLPLHAAGYHGGADGRTVLDRVISSYTPTIAALERSRGEVTPEPGRMLVASLPGLPGAVRSGEMLAALFGPGRSTILDGPAATAGAVLAGLRDHRWAHIDCHGSYSTASPSQSGLQMADGLLTTAQLSRLRYPQGEFAFVDACQTAVPVLTLPDEMISPAAALHYGGYRQVIGTLWTVTDAAAWRVARDVYPRLIDGEQFRPRQAAEALHHAVRTLRDELPGQPSIWAHFTHMGP